ncbi:glycosyltransferase, group 2 family protein [delta proteobacterium NaphS2]|nr:glycosyltransferase, group 2 family protein [delta proteobacterium NaphS2]
MKHFEEQTLLFYLLRVAPVGILSVLLLLSCAVNFRLIPLGEPSSWVQGTAVSPLPAGYLKLLFALQWCFCMSILLALPRFFSGKQKLFLIFAVALICRLLLLGNAPSDDMNRYLWEGRVLARGISPYHHAPDDRLLNSLAKQDPFHEKINHPHMTAAYPPLTVALFSLLGKLWYHPLTIKGTLMMLDLGTMAFLALLLAHRRLDFRWLALYAFNPVILWAFAAEGHFDVIQCFLLAGAICFFDRKKWGWMFLLAGLSVQVKYVSLPAVLFLINRGNFRHVWIALVAVLLPYGLFSLAFANENLHGMFIGILQFGDSFAFNGSIHTLLRVLLGEIEPATMICKVFLAALLIWGLFHFHPERNSRYRNDPVSGCFYVLACILLLAPTVHFWYVSWVIPFLVLQPSRPWMLLCLTIVFYFVTYGIYHHTGVWRLPVWAYLCEWLPFYALLILQGVFFVRQARSGMETNPPRTVSVVIPALNEEELIASCVGETLKDKAVTEAIVIDGGSSDRTRKRAVEAGARVLVDTRSLKEGGGRGGQICKGILAAGGDLVAVVHADTLVKAPAFTGMCDVLDSQPRLCGGALGSLFAGRDPKLGLINFLNDLRAIFLGISFGDQVQFFRRQSVTAKQLFPCIPLMEDVEFGIQLSKLGPQAFLFGNALVSPRRWEVRGFKNAFSVTGRVASYLLKRMGGAPDTQAMYRSYYGKEQWR